MGSQKLLALIFLPGLLAALNPNPAIAETWRWTDENGKVHFSDKPPPDKEITGEQIEVEGPRPIGQGPEVRAIQERTFRLLEAEAEERKEKQREQAEMEAKRTAREQQCRQAEQKVRLLSGPVRYVNEEGERYDVSEERVRQDREKIQKWIEENCS